MQRQVEGFSAASWQETEELRAEGHAGSIGASSFNREHLIPQLERAVIRPAVNQIELHPVLSLRELCAYRVGEAITVESRRPLGGNNEATLREQPVITEIAESCGVMPTRLMMRWSVQNGNIVLVKSVQEDRIRVNAVQYSDEDCACFNDLECNWRIGSDPGKPSIR